MAFESEIRVGKLRFEYAETVAHKKRGRVVERYKYQCPLCSLRVLEAGIMRHLDVHDRREDRKRDTASARELGMGAKPLPGQLGIGLFGVDDVPVEAE